jgi:hypothetical protein
VLVQFHVALCVWWEDNVAPVIASTVLPFCPAEEVTELQSVSLLIRDLAQMASVLTNVSVFFEIQIAPTLRGLY